ncbi:hypothetical protein BDA99DRAFT_537521 [Phascolomyces articulosus]|uniref:DUF4817 domain-containing protein n=1 Tax=Phascolomyces articulosus TaxID=60185 RepID=A0AAD5PFA8_9FUNG|nr:hypothetical protein BDA99DRAFT_537521 [Phascolomyces articulosus]
MAKSSFCKLSPNREDYVWEEYSSGRANSLSSLQRSFKTKYPNSNVPARSTFSHTLKKDASIHQVNGDRQQLGKFAVSYLTYLLKFLDDESHYETKRILRCIRDKYKSRQFKEKIHMRDLYMNNSNAFYWNLGYSMVRINSNSCHYAWVLRLFESTTKCNTFSLLLQVAILRIYFFFDFSLKIVAKLVKFAKMGFAKTGDPPSIT